MKLSFPLLIGTSQKNGTASRRILAELKQRLLRAYSGRRLLLRVSLFRSKRRFIRHSLINVPNIIGNVPALEPACYAALPSNTLVGMPLAIPLLLEARL